MVRLTCVAEIVEIFVLDRTMLDLPRQSGNFAAITCCFRKPIPTGKSPCRAEAHPLRCLHETSEAEHLTSQCLRPGRISLASHVVSVAVIPTRPIDCAAARRQRARPFFPVLHLALPIQL